MAKFTYLDHSIINNNFRMWRCQREMMQAYNCEKEEHLMCVICEFVEVILFKL